VRSARGRAAVLRSARQGRRWEQVRQREVCPAQHLAVSGPEAGPSAQAAWRVRLRVEAWSLWVDRCAAGRQPEHPRAGRRARNARAEPSLRAAPLTEWQSAEPSASWDARVLQAEAVQVAVVHGSGRPPAVVSVPSVPLEAAEAAAPLALPMAAGRAAAEAGAVVPHAEGAEAVPHVGVAGAVPGAAAAAVRPAVPERAVVRSLVAAPFSPSRLRSAPVRRRAATPRVARARRHLPIASPTARWWQAARGGVWS
jgi:hypothetical protein